MKKSKQRKIYRNITTPPPQTKKNLQKYYHPSSSNKEKSTEILPPLKPPCTVYGRRKCNAEIQKRSTEGQQ